MPPAVVGALCPVYLHWLDKRFQRAWKRAAKRVPSDSSTATSGPVPRGRGPFQRKGLELFSESAGRFELRLFDAGGRSRLIRTVELSRGANRIPIEADLGASPAWGRLSGDAATRVFAVASIEGRR